MPDVETATSLTQNQLTLILDKFNNVTLAIKHTDGAYLAPSSTSASDISSSSISVPSSSDPIPYSFKYSNVREILEATPYDDTAWHTVMISVDSDQVIHTPTSQKHILSSYTTRRVLPRKHTKHTVNNYQSIRASYANKQSSNKGQLMFWMERKRTRNSLIT